MSISLKDQAVSISFKFRDDEEEKDEDEDDEDQKPTSRELLLNLSSIALTKNMDKQVVALIIYNLKPALEDAKQNLRLRTAAQIAVTNVLDIMTEAEQKVATDRAEASAPPTLPKSDTF